MNLLFLTEGDAERSSGSGSGTPLSIVRGLRALGHDVRTGDADLHGPAKVVGAALSFWPARQRWAVRYHMNGVPFSLRSAEATRAVAAFHRGGLDAVLQYGATFDPGSRVPYFMYCDSTIRIAARYPEYSWAGRMTTREIDAAAEREGRLYRGARRVFTFSDHVGDLIVDDFGLPHERVQTVYAGPNVDASGLIAETPGRGGAPNILFVGREFARKGGETLLRAFALVRKQLRAATLTIIGPRDLLVGDPGVTNLGYLNNDDPRDRERLLRAYAEATLFCFPTQYEPFGLAILEAMYAGLPCVATRAWAIPEMVIDGETGYTVPAADPDGFARGMLDILQNPELAARMGAAGRARATRHFSWSAVTRAMANSMAADLASG